MLTHLRSLRHTPSSQSPWHWLRSFSSFFRSFYLSVVLLSVVLLVAFSFLYLFDTILLYLSLCFNFFFLLLISLPTPNFFFHSNSFNPLITSSDNLSGNLILKCIIMFPVVCPSLDNPIFGSNF